MKNKYIKSELINNRFICKLEIKIEEVSEPIVVDAIIGIGHSHTNIEVQDLLNGIKNDAERTKMQSKFSAENKIIKQDCIISIEGFNVGKKKLNISSIEPSIIGMDILEGWDVTMSRNKKGKQILIGCPRDNVNPDYFIELNNEFGMDTTINESIVNEKIGGNNYV